MVHLNPIQFAAAGILCRYLGEEGSGSTICAAASFCNPFALDMSSSIVASSLAFVYDILLAFNLRRFVRKRQEILRTNKRIDVDAALRSWTIRQFDVAVTAP